MFQRYSFYKINDKWTWVEKHERRRIRTQQRINLGGQMPQFTKEELHLLKLCFDISNDFMQDAVYSQNG